jgi:hypothetical protein
MCSFMSATATSTPHTGHGANELPPLYPCLLPEVPTTPFALPPPPPLLLPPLIPPTTPSPRNPAMPRWLEPGDAALALRLGIVPTPPPPPHPLSK